MSIQYYLEIVGTFSFAVSGALALKGRDVPDWFAASFTALVTAIGGGSLRDILLGSYPLVWVNDIRVIYAILAGIVATFIFYRRLIRLPKTLFFFDTWGIALFTVAGTEKALSLGIRPEISAIMGMFTAVMGGVIRDTMTNELPIVFRKEIYASACFAGAVVYLLFLEAGIGRDISFVASALFIIILRVLAVRYRWTLPKFFR